MQVKAMRYVYEPYVSLYLIPDTDVERVLLESLWEHGRMEVCNGYADNTEQGFQITQKPEMVKEDENE